MQILQKKLEKIGKFKVPVEVIPFAYNYVLGKVQLLGGSGRVRMHEGTRFITDNGNYILMPILV